VILPFVVVVSGNTSELTLYSTVHSGCSNITILGSNLLSEIAVTIRVYFSEGYSD